jgi:hypothetical protein
MPGGHFALPAFGEAHLRRPMPTASAVKSSEQLKPRRKEKLLFNASLHLRC